MIVQAGRAALSLALALAVYGAVAAILAVRLRRPALVESARRASQAILALTSLAVLAMALLLLRRDYQVLYVYEHVNSSLSSLYAAAALWAGPEGSLLLWLWLLSLFAFLIGHQKAPWARDLEPYALAVISFTQGFFALLLCSVNRPFVLLPARAIEGSGLNPLLENPAMIFHPPALFAGYAAYTVPFAYAVAALASGRLDGQWLRGVRRWNLLAWGLLGLGILLGAQWAYVELGWGGYWAWDPVENASLIPWLTGTALLHSAMVQERRGLFKVWNLLLVIATFLFCILGTLIARSGFVTGSLHTFAPSPVGNLLQAYIVLASLVCL
ncbi:MAG: cytochrome c biogenesis protein CcsA, partial [Anaerolineae bacterium]|nr:cytochrome c biogenesis protein CcsA [Anaerolineae bacterium]